LGHTIINKFQFGIIILIFFQLFYTCNGVYVVMNLKPSYIKIKRT